MQRRCNNFIPIPRKRKGFSDQPCPRRDPEASTRSRTGSTECTPEPQPINRFGRRRTDWNRFFIGPGNVPGCWSFHLGIVSGMVLSPISVSTQLILRRGEPGFEMSAARGLRSCLFSPRRVRPDRVSGRRNRNFSVVKELSSRVLADAFTPSERCSILYEKRPTCQVFPWRSDSVKISGSPESDRKVDGCSWTCVYLRIPRSSVICRHVFHKARIFTEMPSRKHLALPVSRLSSSSGAPFRRGSFPGTTSRSESRTGSPSRSPSGAGCPSSRRSS